MSPKSQAVRPTSSLLYRLIGTEGEDPNAPVGVRVSRRQQSRRMDELRRQIERDLQALFETRHLSADTDLSAWPNVQQSVLNYGIADLSGTTGSSIDPRQLQRELLVAIKRYEPRLKPETLTVKCDVHEYGTNDLLVRIEALFGPADALEMFSMGVSICLESGQCRRMENRLTA